MMLQQPLLIETPNAIICVHCHEARAVVLNERQVIDVRFGDYPGWSQAPCCTPESDYHCPACHSSKLEFAMHFASAEGEETGEVYRCLTCGSTGDVEEAAPPVQPWAELEAVMAAEEPVEEYRLFPAAIGPFEPPPSRIESPIYLPAQQGKLFQEVA
jgi:hypothetical protein